MLVGPIITTAVDLSGAGIGAIGAPDEVPVVSGEVYELRCSQPVRVADGAKPSVRSVQVRPETPLVFRASSSSISIAAESAQAMAWVRRVEVVG
jgi:hypothetical protein